MALSRKPTLLVLRALGIGDLLTGVPALRALRRARPGHRLVLAAPRGLAPLVALIGAVDQLLDITGLDGPLDADQPDIAVNLHGRGPQSHRLLLALEPRELVAFGCAEAGHSGPAWRIDEHERDRWCRLVSEAWGAKADPDDLLLARPAAPRGTAGAFVVHPGAAYPARRWPPERFAAVASWAASQGHRVLVTGSADEHALAAGVAREAGLPASAVVAGRVGLLELAGIVASARLLVCGDTGVGHLASAYRTPSVLLFGPTPPARWGPPDAGPHTVVWHPSPTGNPWGRRVDPALLEVTVDEVISAVGERLARNEGVMA